MFPHLQRWNNFFFSLTLNRWQSTSNWCFTLAEVSLLLASTIRPNLDRPLTCRKTKTVSKPRSPQLPRLTGSVSQRGWSVHAIVDDGIWSELEPATSGIIALAPDRWHDDTFTTVDFANVPSHEPNWQGEACEMVRSLTRNASVRSIGGCRSDASSAAAPFERHRRRAICPVVEWEIEKFCVDLLSPHAERHTTSLWRHLWYAYHTCHLIHKDMHMPL